MKLKLVFLFTILSLSIIISPRTVWAVKPLINSEFSKDFSLVQKQQGVQKFRVAIKNWIQNIRFKRKTKEKTKREHLLELILWIALAFLIAFTLTAILGFLAIIVGSTSVAMIIPLLLGFASFIIPVVVLHKLISRYLRNYYKKIKKDVSRQNVGWQALLIMILVNIPIILLRLLSTL